MVGVAIGVGFGAADGRAEPAAAIDDSAFATAGWAGAAFRDPSSGLFAFCRQGRAFDDGTVLTFSLDAIGHLDVGLVGGPWMAGPDGPDGPLPAAARLDDIGPVALDGRVGGDGALVVSLDNDPAILAAFRRAYVFEIVGDAFGPLSFDLAGTAASLSDLRRCVITYRDAPPLSPPVETVAASDPASDPASGPDAAALVIEALGRLQADMAAPDAEIERQSLDRLLLTGLAERLTGGLGLTIDGANAAPPGLASPVEPAARPLTPPPPSRPYRIGNQGGFGSDGLYGRPYTILPPSAPYSINTPGTANPYRR